MRRLPLSLRGPLVGVMALGAVLGAGCSSSSDSSSSPSTTKAPEDILVTNAKVTAGLASLGTLVRTAASQAKANPAAAQATMNQASEQWEAIEGRIKKNDTDAYLQFEDALSDMRIGAEDKDATKVSKGAGNLATIAAAYVAKFPG